MTRHALALAVCLFAAAPVSAQAIDYRVLATSKTSTMEGEMNDAGAMGFKFVSVMGGETAGGSEVVVLMQKGGAIPEGNYRYKLLATSKTSTMQREMSDAAQGGYDYVGQTVFSSAFGGDEVVSIVERTSASVAGSQYAYRLVATSKTSTLQKEMNDLARDGFSALGMTVGNTALGGSELVVIARKKR